MGSTPNTQNQRWANDKSAFGYRMLQKMGWREGKGLGLHEDGSTEHLRLRARRATHGIGAVSSTDSVWAVPAQVAVGLNDVLARLAPKEAGGGKKGVETQGEGKKEGGGRGYYQRRAARKNVRNYSEAALKEIFGGADRATEADRAGRIAGGRGERVGKESGIEREGTTKVKVERREVEVRVEPVAEEVVQVKWEVKVNQELEAKPEVLGKDKLMKEEVDTLGSLEKVEVTSEVIVKQEHGVLGNTKIQGEPVDKADGSAKEDRRERKRLRKLARKEKEERKRKKAKKLSVASGVGKVDKDRKKKTKK